MRLVLGLAALALILAGCGPADGIVDKARDTAIHACDQMPTLAQRAGCWRKAYRDHPIGTEGTR